MNLKNEKKKSKAKAILKSYHHKITTSQRAKTNKKRHYVGNLFHIVFVSISFPLHPTGRADKLDNSFSRSRSSSMSSLENISSEAVTCLAFVDSYTKKSGEFCYKNRRKKTLFECL